MIYSYTISTPANTPKSAKQETKIALAKGVIHKIEIDFPPGNLGKLHVAIRGGLEQIFPSNESSDLIGDDRLISFPEYYEILTAPYEMTVETWNESLNNAHSISIRIGLLPRQYVLRRTI